MSRDIEREQEAELAWEALKERLTRPPTLLPAAQMLAAAEVEPAFLVKQAIPAGAITLIVGEPGAKKSWLAYGLALATARCSDWLGRRVTPRGASGSVLILNYDNPTAECGRRFKRLGMVASDPIYFHSPEGPEALRLPEAARELRALHAALRPSLVVVDSLRQAHTCDENSSKEMAIVMGCLKALCVDGTAVAVVHHASKSEIATGLTKTRGSGEIAASADAQISVSSLDGDDLATWDKHRSWRLDDADAQLGFRLVDRGDATRLEVC